MPDIRSVLASKFEEYLLAKKELEAAAAELRRCESKVDELLNNFRRENTESRVAANHS